MVCFVASDYSFVKKFKLFSVSDDDVSVFAFSLLICRWLSLYLQVPGVLASKLLVSVTLNGIVVTKVLFLLLCYYIFLCLMYTWHIYITVVCIQ